MVLWAAVEVFTDIEVHLSVIQGVIVVITDELKEAVVAMMVRKEEVEEQMKFVLFIHFRVLLTRFFSWIFVDFSDKMALLLFFYAVL